MTMVADLVVVGAGPVGLSTALAARSLGVDVVLLEAEPEDRPRPGSRALYVHRQTLTALDQMSPGLGRSIADFGVVWRTTRTCYAGREVYVRQHGPKPGDRLPPYVSLRQVDTERFLLKACREAGVRVEWAAPAESVSCDADSVTVRVTGGRAFRCRYVVGADGARSAVRSSLGIGMDGERSGEYRVAVDLADGEEKLSTDRVMHYRHPGMSGRNLLVVPFAGGAQVDVQGVDEADVEELSSPRSVHRWLPKVLPGVSEQQILWTARYPCLQRVADSFVDEERRVLLAGEAAHLFMPFGARGMNSGIADADAAAGAVAVALRATNPRRARAAVEGYDRVRRQAAHHNRACVEDALRHLRADTARAKVTQYAAARLAPLVPRFGTWLDRAPYGPRGTVMLSGGMY